VNDPPSVGSFFPGGGMGRELVREHLRHYRYLEKIDKPRFLSFLEFSIFSVFSGWVSVGVSYKYFIDIHTHYIHYKRR
jgi:hypothetical protein